MKSLLLVVLLLPGNFCLAQENQVSFQVSSGLFSFGGSSATETSFLNLSDVSSIPHYTNNPYGSKSGFSYGLGIQFHHVTPGKFIYGLQCSYESLSSRVKIDKAFGDILFSVVDGETKLTSDFFTLTPSLGQRVVFFEGVDTDFLLGLDFAFGLSSKEHYNVTTSQGNEISGSTERDVQNMDFRPRIEIVNYYKRFGLSVGYSHGVTNYQANLDGANREVKARYIRFGLNYRLSKI